MADKWADNAIQFPRLIAEIRATQTLDIDALCESMDLAPEHIEELFDRADEAWEVAKLNRPEPAPLALRIETDEDGEQQLVCPHCETADAIYEVDIAERWNEGEPSFEDGKLVAIWWGRGQGDFHHDHYRCMECNRRVDLPEGVNESELSQEWN